MSDGSVRDWIAVQQSLQLAGELARRGDIERPTEVEFACRRGRYGVASKAEVDPSRGGLGLRCRRRTLKSTLVDKMVEGPRCPTQARFVVGLVWKSLAFGLDSWPLCGPVSTKVSDDRRSAVGRSVALETSQEVHAEVYRGSGVGMLRLSFARSAAASALSETALAFELPLDSAALRGVDGDEHDGKIVLG